MIQVVKTKAETEIKGIVHGIPTSETDDEISALLREQGVIESFKSRINTESNTASWIVKFATHRPHSIVLAFRSFPVIEFKRKPTHCTKCWGFGHTTGALTLPVVESVRITIMNPLNANPHQNAQTVLIPLILLVACLALPANSDKKS